VEDEGVKLEIESVACTIVVEVVFVNAEVECVELVALFVVITALVLVSSNVLAVLTASLVVLVNWATPRPACRRWSA